MRHTSFHTFTALVLVVSTIFFSTASTTPTFSGNWVAGSDATDSQNIVNPGTDWNTFIDLVNTRHTQSLRLETVRTYVESGVRKWAGVWRPGTDTLLFDAGLTIDAFHDLNQHRFDDGLRLVDFETYTEGSQRLWAGIWRPGTGAHWYNTHLDLQSFVDLFSQRHNDSLRLIDIMTYVEQGERKWGGIWVPGDDGEFLFVDMDRDAFHNKLQELHPQGFTVTSLETYNDNGIKWAAVWRSKPGPIANSVDVGLSATSLVDLTKQRHTQGLSLSTFAVQGSDGITIYTQNTALLPVFFAGVDKNAIINGLMNFLRENKPDVAALSEVWLEDDRIQIINAMKDIYPNGIQGPEISFPNFLGAGLVLLSKFPVHAKDESIYKDCAGEDCTSNKGIVFVRIQPPMGPQIDVFLTHTQNPDPTLSSGSNGRGALSRQLDHLADFVRSKRDHHLPAIVIGDLNVNADVPGDYNELVGKMEFTVDAWKDNHPNEPGFTLDYRGCFERSKVSNPSCNAQLGDKAGCVNSSGVSECDRYVRGVSGHRIDYFLGYSGLGIDAAFRNTRTIKIILSNGHDLSDHLGLWTEFSTSAQPPPSTAPIGKMTVSFNRFHCLKATDGPLEPVSSLVGSDEIEVSLAIEANGARQETGRSQTFEDINSGTVQFVRGQTLSVSNVNADLRIQSNMWEVDDFEFIVTFRTGEAFLFIEGRTLTLTDLRYLRGKQMKFAMRGTGAGGEYVAQVLVGVDFTPPPVPPPPPPKSPPHACAGQISGPEGCLNQFLRITSPSFEPNTYVRWPGLDARVTRTSFRTSDDIRWDFVEPRSDGSFQIKSKGVSLCMASAFGRTVPTMADCLLCPTLFPDECRWTFLGEDVTGFTQVSNKARNKCLSVPNGPSLSLELVECSRTSDPSQMFRLENAPV